MRTSIKNKLITTSTAKLVIIAIALTLLLSSLLTTATSFVMLGEFSLELLLANSVIGVIIPSIVAPFMINLIKTANNWEQVNQQLKAENIKRKKIEGEASQKAMDMKAISELAIQCAAAPNETDIVRLIAEKLRDVTNALGVGITVYDPETRTLTTKHIAVSGQILSAANRLIGHNLVGMVNTVTPEMEKQMLQGMTETFTNLSEVTFGLIPLPIATTIKNTLGIGKFTGMALIHGGKLIGTAIIAQREEQPNLDIEVCKTLAHVSAVSIQRRKAEVELRESETKFRAIIENLSEGILLLGEHGYLLEWNPAQEALTGFKREEVLGRPVWDVQFDTMPEHLQTSENYEYAKHQTQVILTTGESPYLHNPMEITIQSKDGSAKQVVQTLFPIQTDAGYRIGSLMRDISARKQAEADRNRLITELKSKNTELEQFTYTVSHDLKAPLITIKGFLGLLETDAIEGNIERMKQDIFRITEATEKMQRLLNELLELSRIGRVVNPSQATAFEEIVHDAATTVRGRLDAENVKLTIEQDLPTVFVDRTRIVQVMQNLLDNAAKFMGNQANPQIIVGTQGFDRDNKPIFYVKDNGIGVEQNQIDNLFGLFRKLDIKAEGTGIGLGLVKRIIEVHGGRVWITSDGPGQGTTVWFPLPIP